MVMWWWCAVAMGQEEPPVEEGGEPADEPAPVEEPDPEPEPEVITIPPFSLDDGLEGFEEEARRYEGDPDGGLDDILVDWGGPPVMLRGRWYIRPLLSWTHLQGPTRSAAAVRFGAAFGRQWFTAGAGAVQGGGGIDIDVSAPVGGAVGYRLRGSGTVGPWLGPVGLRVGPAARLDRSEWGAGSMVLDTALLVGARATLAFDLGPLKPYVEVEPAWAVTGTRPEASAVTATLPVLGTETTWGAGLAYHAGWIVWSAHGDWAETGLGRMLEIGVGLHLRPGGKG